MGKKFKFQIEVDDSLLEQVRERLEERHSTAMPEEAIVSMITDILDGSDLPIGAKKTEDQRILLSYHLRSFSQS
ncbi:MAG: hypothetical protein GY703_10460, partial [Gammaproteobacteria bacterium]|nr:hypothetical protein [Gammaproteobacteria bacterium]